ncbi:hypothetical protein CHL67_07405 [Prosthecochloris sp. GSB1]|uniref:TolC family protein n=1 Tax=Prosthecochloris sp. GSB1 TaxID=281093 RepID=UPI000B8CCA93|nr:TolC family protein [Prosthecochloris sp. GSB1]ASQ90769.1 hypothetical protein CHL67_07405 [Prosthecochloris sp. GSB1]
MKKILATLFLALLPFTAGFASVGNPAVDDSVLTLEQAKKTALENNPGVRQTLARIDAARGVLGQAYAAWFPTVTATGGYIRRHVDIQPDWQPETRFKKDFNDITGGLQLNWLLFDGFSRRARTLAARNGVEEARHVHENSRRLLVESVATAYYQAQLARENMRIAEQNAAFNRSLEKNAKIRREVGSAPRSELLNFSIRSIQAESDSIEAERNYTVACSVLGELMGLSDGKLPCATVPPPDRDGIDDTIPSFETLVSVALEKRPDLQAVESAIEAAKHQKNAVKGAYLPSIALSAGLNYEKQNGIDPVQEERNRYAGLTASWELFSGGKRSAGFQQKKAEEMSLVEEKRRVILSIRSSIRQSIANAEATQAQWRRQQEALSMTEQVRHDIELLYRTGSANLTRLNEAQTDLVRAASLAASSKIRFLLALDKLRTESGQIPETP